MSVAAQAPPRRVLFVQPSLRPVGGGNTVAAWILEALKGRCHLTILTATPVDFDEINHFSGTSLGPSDVEVRMAKSPVQHLLDRVPLRLALLENLLLVREARALAADFDAVLTAANEADFGRPGVQYVHFPWALHPRPDVDLKFYHLAPLVALYRRSCVALTGFSFERARANVTLVNSRWTGALYEKCHGVRPTVLHPPVIGTFPDVAWEDRDEAFVAIGRVAPEKEVEKLVAILSRVRELGAPVRLTIVGRAGDGDYARSIRALIAANGSWVTHYEGLSRDELIRTIARHRYGIHGMREEHFGMAVAEMVRGGCIPFVPRGGGQVEIVGEEERLVYDSEDDAIAKILGVLGDRAAQEALRADLAVRAGAFSVDRFAERIRELAGV